MAQAMAPPPHDSPAGFVDFYRGDYRLLITVAMAAGATLEEAYEAVDQTMEEVLLRWSHITYPRAYARQAVVSNFVKRRRRDRERLLRTIKGGHLTQESVEDHELNVWEDDQWVAQLLQRLPPTQREVMRCVLAGLDTGEIAELLGKTPHAIRKNLQLARERLRALLHGEPRLGRSRAR